MHKFVCLLNVSVFVYVLLLCVHKKYTPTNLYIYLCIFAYILACILTYVYIFLLSVDRKEWDKGKECEMGRVDEEEVGNGLLQSEWFLFLLILFNFMIAKGLFDVNMKCLCILSDDFSQPATVLQVLKQRWQTNCWIYLIWFLEKVFVYCHAPIQPRQRLADFTANDANGINSTWRKFVQFPSPMRLHIIGVSHFKENTITNVIPPSRLLNLRFYHCSLPEYRNFQIYLFSRTFHVDSVQSDWTENFQELTKNLNYHILCCVNGVLISGLLLV